MKLSFFLIVFFLQVIANSSVSTGGLACNPQRAHMDCLKGCLGCFEAFGGDVYDTAACCWDCQRTGALLLDYGPSKCSDKYVRKDWLKRQGWTAPSSENRGLSETESCCKWRVFVKVFRIAIAKYLGIYWWPTRKGRGEILSYVVVFAEYLIQAETNMKSDL